MLLTRNFKTVFFICSVLVGLNTSANVLIMNGLTHEHQALQGEVKDGVIQLKNIGDSPRSVQIYQRDYWYWYTGENRHDEPGTLPRSNANWIDINPVFVTLQPDESATIEYTISVPENDTLTGTYWSVIMVEGINPPDTTATEQGIKINTVIRYAIQVITNIGDTGQRSLSFLNFNLAEYDHITELTVDIENTGERLLRPEVSVEVYNSDGEEAGVIKADKRKIYPGTSARIVLDLSKLDIGLYSGILIADCGDDYVFGSNLSLEIKND